jgi:hypothetical protein
MLKYQCSQVSEKMKAVKSYEEWEEYAILLDQLEGLNKWKTEKASPFYNYERIESRYLMMKHLRK